MRARYYNPVIGRFISEDSYKGKDNDPLSLNLYTYCHNDPINFNDPSGHWDHRVHYSWTKAEASRLGLSPQAAEAIATGDNSVDNLLNPFRSPANPFSMEAQGWHFDKNSDINVDTRMQHAMECFNKAVEMWKNAESDYNKSMNLLTSNKNLSSQTISAMSYKYKTLFYMSKIDALQTLGNGLHPLQDIYAHMDYDAETGKTTWAVHHEANGDTTKFDNPDYDFYKDQDGYHSYYVGSWASQRVIYTQFKTNQYIQNFIDAINYKK